MGADEDLTRECPTCSGATQVRRFDLAVRRPDGRERTFFGLLAALCGSCGRFVLDPDAVDLYGIEELDIASAIQSDVYMRPAGGVDVG